MVSKIFLIFTSTWGFMIQFDEHMFQMGWFNHQPVMVGCFTSALSLGFSPEKPFQELERRASEKRRLLEAGWHQRLLIACFDVHIYFVHIIYKYNIWYHIWYPMFIGYKCCVNRLYISYVYRSIYPMFISLCLSHSSMYVWSIPIGFVLSIHQQ